MYSHRPLFGKGLHSHFHPNLPKFLKRVGLLNEDEYKIFVDSDSKTEYESTSISSDNDEALLTTINAKVRELYPPTLANLRLLHRQFYHFIPFENLALHWTCDDPSITYNPDFASEYLTIKVSDPAFVEKKVCDHYRGGYCFELNQYFYLILRELGFQVTPRMARVKWNFPPNEPTGRTHFMNIVSFPRNSKEEDDEQIVLAQRYEGLILKEEGREEGVVYYLCDVSFGGPGYIEPLRLCYDVIQSTEYDAHRVVCLGDDLVEVQIAMVVPVSKPNHADLPSNDDLGLPPPPPVFHKEWRSMYNFDFFDLVALHDVEISNWYISTHPKSVFKNNIMMNMVTAEGKVSIFNRDVMLKRIISETRERTKAQSIEEYDELMRVEKKTCTTQEEFLDILRTHYRLRIPDNFRIIFPHQP